MGAVGISLRLADARSGYTDYIRCIYQYLRGEMQDRKGAEYLPEAQKLETRRLIKTSDRARDCLAALVGNRDLNILRASISSAKGASPRSEYKKELGASQKGAIDKERRSSMRPVSARGIPRGAVDSLFSQPIPYGIYTRRQFILI